MTQEMHWKQLARGQLHHGGPCIPKPVLRSGFGEEVGVSSACSQELQEEAGGEDGDSLERWSEATFHDTSWAVDSWHPVLPAQIQAPSPSQPFWARGCSHQEVREAASASTESVSKAAFLNGPFRVYFSEHPPPLESGTLALGYSQGSHVF